MKTLKLVLSSVCFAYACLVVSAVASPGFSGALSNSSRNAELSVNSANNTGGSSTQYGYNPNSGSIGVLHTSQSGYTVATNK